MLKKETAIDLPTGEELARFQKVLYHVKGCCYDIVRLTPGLPGRIAMMFQVDEEELLRQLDPLRTDPTAHALGSPLPQIDLRILTAIVMFGRGDMLVDTLSAILGSRAKPYCEPAMAVVATA